MPNNVQNDLHVTGPQADLDALAALMPAGGFPGLAG